MTVAILGVGGVRDEVVAGDELRGVEVRGTHVAAVIRVRDTGVEHCHDDPGAVAAGVPRGDKVGPGLWRLHAPLPVEVPLQRLPSAGGAARTGIVG